MKYWIWRVLEICAPLIFREHNTFASLSLTPCLSWKKWEACGWFGFCVPLFDNNKLNKNNNNQIVCSNGRVSWSNWCLMRLNIVKTYTKHSFKEREASEKDIWNKENWWAKRKTTRPSYPFSSITLKPPKTCTENDLNVSRVEVKSVTFLRCILLFVAAASPTNYRTHFENKCFHKKFV